MFCLFLCDRLLIDDGKVDAWLPCQWMYSRYFDLTPLNGRLDS